MHTHPTVAVGIVLIENDRVLLIQRGKPPGQGRWTVPGGKVELGESLEAAALRELAEETGLRCTLGPIVEVLDRVVKNFDKQVEYHYVIIDFIGTAPVGQLQAASDCADARWFHLDEIAGLDTTDDLLPVLTRALGSVHDAETGIVRGPTSS